jgi:putative endonuclease
MDDDTPALLFELARRRQAARLRRRRLAARKAGRDEGGGGAGAASTADFSSSGANAGRRPAAAHRHQEAADACEVVPRMSPTQQLGSVYEQRALELLAGAGLQPLARNLRCRTGEIDLAVRDGDTLVLVEVRARGDGRFGGAAASVDWAKQARLVRAAHCLVPRLAARHWAGRPPRVRFDVVAFEGEQPVWLRQAFDAD